jgi:chromosome segregation ATPase
VLILSYFFGEKITWFFVYCFFLLKEESNMTRIKEPEIGHTEVPDYKSPPSRIIKSLRKAYDNVREKLAHKSQKIMALQGAIRDVQESRDEWKARYKDMEAKLTEIEKKNVDLQNELKKKIIA